jgi:tRNA(Ile)-lysidine synthase TilS/MesJ
MVIVNLYYDPHDNTITHEDGRILNDLSNLISDKELLELKRLGGVKYIESPCNDITYELDFPIPDEIMTFYYEPEQNIICDDDGFIMFNVFQFITPQQLLLFKHKKDDMRVIGKNGETIDLLYPKY